MKINRREFIARSGAAAAGVSMMGGFMGNVFAGPGLIKKGPMDYVIVHGHYDIWEFNARLAMEDEAQNSPLRDFLLPRLLAGGVNIVIMPVAGEAARHRIENDQVLAGSLRTTDMIIREIEKTNGKASIIKSKKDIPEVPDPNHVKFFFDIEGGSPIEIDAEPGLYKDQRLSLLRHFYRVGVRGLQLTRDGRNQLGDGWLEGKGGNLSRFGVEVVEEMNRLGMMVGVSHVSENAVLHAAEISKHPIVSTHQNPRKFMNSLLELSDDMIKAIAKTGGIAGVRFHSDKKTPYESLVDMIDYIANLVGIEHTGIGPIGHDKGCSGIDHEAVTSGTQSQTKYEQYSRLIELLDKRFSEKDIALIMGGNYLRIWKQILPDS
ncbi:MAG TPA: membrane dipeptidase [Chryseolinea sp.]|nr:membrane dipeptidase [Chryseolinea sp.]